jgi:hypothetical protein
MKCSKESQCIEYLIIEIRARLESFHSISHGRNMSFSSIPDCVFNIGCLRDVLDFIENHIPAA